MNIPNEIKRAAAGATVKEIAVEAVFSVDVGYDTRHVLNLAAGIDPGIDPAAIERAGVVIEDLLCLRVPVCKYKTQVTIHGVFPAATIGRCAGYKSLVVNGNGSLGVRYVAIDAGKKALVMAAICAARLAARDTGTDGPKWSFNQDSTGTELTLCAPLARLQELRDRAAMIPRRLFVGGVSIHKAPLYGLAWLAVGISAIPSETLWDFIGHFTGITSRTALDALTDEQRKRRDAEEAQRSAEREQARVARANAAADVRAGIERDHGLRAVAPVAGGHYIRVCRDLAGATLWKHCTVSKAFGRLVFRSETVAGPDEAQMAVTQKRAIQSKGREVTGRETFFTVAA
jgi:hypothetical protein